LVPRTPEEHIFQTDHFRDSRPPISLLIPSLMVETNPLKFPTRLKYRIANFVCVQIPSKDNQVLSEKWPLISRPEAFQFQECDLKHCVSMQSEMEDRNRLLEYIWHWVLWSQSACEHSIAFREHGLETCYETNIFSSFTTTTARQ
jgi:hypothetical protein